MTIKALIYGGNAPLRTITTIEELAQLIAADHAQYGETK